MTVLQCSLPSPTLFLNSPHGGDTTFGAHLFVLRHVQLLFFNGSASLLGVTLGFEHSLQKILEENEASSKQEGKL